MRFKIPEKDRKSSLDITPLLDIIFLVLIFFMVSVTFGLDRSIKLTLPKSFVSESSIASQKIVIEVGGDSRVALNGEEILLNDLSARIKGIDNFSSRSVYIFADNQTPYKTIIGIMDILKLLGLDSISLVTDAKEDL